jgi:3-ketosteroid 9alpha-monooxygenase subunit B
VVLWDIIAPHRPAGSSGPDHPLSGLGVPGARVHVERFVSLAENPFEMVALPGGLAATLSVTSDGVTTPLPWPGGVRMLDVLIEAGLDAPYSCRQGICGACACQLTGGQVVHITY